MDTVKRRRTYKKGSRHNLYNAELTSFYVRVNQTLRRQIEVEAEKRGMTLADFARLVLGEAVKDVVLTSADFKLISERMEVNEERNAARVARQG